MHYETLTRTVGDTISYDSLPDFEQFRVAVWAIEDTVVRTALEDSA